MFAIAIGVALVADRLLKTYAVAAESFVPPETFAQRFCGTTPVRLHKIHFSFLFSGICVLYTSPLLPIAGAKKSPSNLWTQCTG